MKTVVRGSALTLRFQVFADAAKTIPYPDLAAATRVRVGAVESRDRTVAFNLASDAVDPVVTVDDPATGWVTAELTTAHMTLDQGRYSVGLAIDTAGGTTIMVVPDAFQIVASPFG